MFSRDALAEEERLLEDERDRTPHVCEAQLAKVEAVEQDAAALRVVEARQQARDGALARAGRSDERERLARSDVQIEPVEHGVVALVPEPNPCQLDVSSRWALELARMAGLLRVAARPRAPPLIRALAATAFCNVVTRWPSTRSGQTSIATYALKATNEPSDEVAGDHAPAAEPEHGERSRAAAASRGSA